MKLMGGYGFVVDDNEHLEVGLHMSFDQLPKEQGIFLHS
jgi:hypothetical protein